MADEISVEQVAAWLLRFAEVVAENREDLTALDSAIGDADHGANLDRGMKAVADVLGDLDPTGLGPMLTKAGMTLVSKVGGASGPLYGTFFMRVGSSLGDVPTADAEQLAAALRAGLDGVAARGKAQVGDKTMLDALTPAVDAVDAALAEGASLHDALQRASTAADEGRDATVPLVAHKGRASYLGERSAGHQDPGATSVALLLAAAAATL